MSRNKKIIKTTAEFSRFLLGLTFLFSGFVKAVDPLGFTYKIQDYLIAFNSASLFALALPVAIILIVFEFSCGVFILLGIFRKQTTLLTTLFMLIFTPFTLWIALKNPVKDCGCFGDFLIISNWETFLKNIVLLIGTIFLLLYHKRLNPLFSKKMRLAPAIFTLIFSVAFCIYNLTIHPIFDFRPFKIGANIPSLMHIDTQQNEEYKHTFVYRKDGKEQEFTEENYPWNDSTWTFVEMKSKLIQKSETPEIEDFSIQEMFFDPVSNSWEEREDTTEKLLSDSSYQFLMVSPLPTKKSLKQINAFQPICRYAKENRIPFYLLSSSFTASQKPMITDCSYGLTDERVLKTMIRANPGLLLIKKGTVLKKWNATTLPSVKKIDAGINNNKYVQNAAGKSSAHILLKLGLILLIFIIPMLLFKQYERKRCCVKKQRDN